MACTLGLMWIIILIWGEVALISGAIESISHGNSGGGAFNIVMAIIFWIFWGFIGRALAEILD